MILVCGSGFGFGIRLVAIEARCAAIAFLQLSSRDYYGELQHVILSRKVELGTRGRALLSIQSRFEEPERLGELLDVAGGWHVYLGVNREAIAKCRAKFEVVDSIHPDGLAFGGREALGIFTDAPYLEPGGEPGDTSSRC